jgi:hypothetical protein
MPVERFDFGFLPDRLDIEGAGYAVSTTADFEARRAAVLNSCRVADHWYYPPLVERFSVNPPPAAPPLTYQTPFQLPSTHTLALTDDDEHLALWLISILGVIKGYPLKLSKHGHIHRAVVSGGLLTDIGHLYDRECIRVLDAAYTFWNQETDHRSQAFAAIHWFLLARVYPYEFERFVGLYAAFDACYGVLQAMEIAENVGRTHYLKPQKLCEALKIAEVPAWATIEKDDDGKFCQLSRLRNALMHDAVYRGEPVGWRPSTEVGNLELEFRGLILRAIIALLRVDCSYTSASVTSGAAQGLGLR